MKFQESGIRLVIATTDDWPRNGPPASPEYVSLRTWLKAPFTGRNIKDVLVIPRGLLSLLRDLRPDLAVTEDLAGLPGNLVFNAHRRLGGCDYLIWSLGDSILGKKRSWYRPLAYPMIESFRRGASGFIGYSDWACDGLSRKYDKPVYPAYNSTVAQADIIDVAKQAPTRAGKDGPLRLIFIGRLLPQKKIDVLVSAVARSGNDIELDVVGSGPCMTELTGQAKRLKAASRIRFHGAVYDDERKRELMDTAHIAVLPGLGGLFIQEAYARGLPVICGPADGTEQDLVKSINPEFYLEEVTVESLLDRFGRFSSNRGWIQSAALAANRIVRHKYNVENMVDGWTAAVLPHMRRAT